MPRVVLWARVGVLVALLSSFAGCSTSASRANAGRPTSQIHAASTCLGPDEDSAYFSQVITGVVTDSDSVAVRLRAGLDLPQLTPQQVTLITDSRTCAKAAAAIDAREGVRDTAGQMYVFKLGNTRFAVIQLRQPPPHGVFSSAPTLVRYFDSKWNWLSMSGV